MLFSNLHAKIMEDEKKASSIDGRRFNKRSRVRMDREVQVINRSIAKAKRKKSSRKNTFRGVFSEEEIQFANEEKEKFRLACAKKKENDVVNSLGTCENIEVIKNSPDIVDSTLVADGDEGSS